MAKIFTAKLTNIRLIGTIIPEKTQKKTIISIYGFYFPTI